MPVTYEFEDCGDGVALARIHTAGDASGFYSLAGPLLAAGVRRGVTRDLERLRSLLEEGGPPPAASPGAPPS